MSAQQSANDAAMTLRRMGARFPTDREFEAYRKASYVLRPVILPTTAQRAALPRLPGETARSYEVRIRRDMASLAWLDVHDLAVWDQLREWDLTRPVFNYGKLWIGIGKIRGWWQDPGYIQVGLRPQHNGLHFDYATKFHAFWDSDPTATIKQFTREALC